MSTGQVLEFSGVTKRFGPVTAVDSLDARVEPGTVTGFLGPNGAGKTTSLRILLGLVKASSGVATIGGKRYADLDRPLLQVGAALEASSFHPGRSAANHLAVYAAAVGLPRTRVDAVLGLVGLSDVAGRKVGGFSLGMRQRLGLAYTLLGDPGVLLLDEPANGLDPEGIKWMRGFLRALAAEGRTVLVSSHLLAEIQQTADSLLIVARGRMVFQGTMDELTALKPTVTIVESPNRTALGTLLERAGLDPTPQGAGFAVASADTTTIGALVAEQGIALSLLHRTPPELESIFLELVRGDRTADAAEPAPDLPPPDAGSVLATPPADGGEGHGRDRETKEGTS